jgi:hypothetical protein
VQRCAAPAGDDAAQPFRYLGTVGVKRFLDKNLRAMRGGVTYPITAFRSTTRGNAARFSVNFGAA